MPKIIYTEKRFSAAHRKLIDDSNVIIEEYAEQGYELTLRQLFYQHVARGLIPNTNRSYKMLGNVISDARRAGLVDWAAIVDRTRNLRRQATWESPAEIVEACASQFTVDFWKDQPNYIEAWIEKDALVGVLEVACQPFQIPHFSCRGYVSDSEAWAAGRRIREKVLAGKEVVILHLGDHDPSGIDMTRDIQSRLELFSQEDEIDVRRLALNMAQVEEFNPPPNPAKMTDSRFRDYERLHGDESWELDALDPKVIAALISREVQSMIDYGEWTKAKRTEKAGQKKLADVAKGLSK